MNEKGRGSCNISTIKNSLLKLEEVINWKCFINIIYINSNHSLLRWSVSPKLCSERINILISSSDKNEMLRRLTSLQVIESDLDEDKLFDIILNACMGWSVKDTDVSDETLKLCYKTMKLMSELVFGESDNAKVYSNKKMRFRRRYNLDSDFEMVVFNNLVWSLPSEYLKLRVEDISYKLPTPSKGEGLNVSGNNNRVYPWIYKEAVTVLGFESKI